MSDTRRGKKIAARILDNRLLSGHTYRMDVTPEVHLEGVTPGRFFMLQVDDSLEPFLPRPFSVGDLSQSDSGQVLSFFYHACGRGTRLLASRRPDSSIRLLGPLGNGFHLDSSAQGHLMVAGGIGAAPFELLARALKDEDEMARLTWLVGARTAGDLMFVDSMKRRGAEVLVATDDGSAGTQSTVIEPLVRWLDEADRAGTAIYVCGPDPMMKAVAVVLAERGLEAQFSLEAYMACGVGVCNGCAVEVTLPSGDTAFKKVCADGPVMRLGEVWGHLSGKAGDGNAQTEKRNPS